MLVCGIDPGLQRTGYGVVRASGDALSVVEAGVISTADDGELADRLLALANDLGQLFSEHKVDVFGVEALYSHYKHPRTAVLMGHARGVILSEARRGGAAVMEFSATQVKRNLTGNGRASKSQMQRAVTQRLGLSVFPEPADVADALAIGLCAIDARNLASAVVK